jgi:hypothetical protein
MKGIAGEGGLEKENFGKRKADRIKISTGEHTGNHGVDE